MSAEGGLGALLGAYDSDSGSQDQASDLPHAVNNAQEDAATAAAALGAVSLPQPPTATVREPSDIAQPMHIEEEAEEARHEEPMAHPPHAPTTASPSVLALASSSFEALPPELAAPSGECNTEVQDRVSRWLDLQQQGRRLTDTLRASRDYRNPEFFKKMIEYWEIDEHGTAFPPETFDPGSLPEEDTIDALKKEWAEEEEKRKTARAAGTAHIEFMKSGGAGGGLPTQGKGASGTATAAAVAAAQAKAAALAAAHRR